MTRVRGGVPGRSENRRIDPSADHCHASLFESLSPYSVRPVRACREPCLAPAQAPTLGSCHPAHRGSRFLRPTSSGRCAQGARTHALKPPDPERNEQNTNPRRLGTVRRLPSLHCAPCLSCLMLSPTAVRSVSFLHSVSADLALVPLSAPNCRELLRSGQAKGEDCYAFIPSLHFTSTTGDYICCAPLAGLVPRTGRPTPCKI